MARFSFLTKLLTDRDGKRVTLADSSPTPVPAGRVSLDANANFMTSTSLAIQPPPGHNDFWKLKFLDYNNLDAFTPQELLDFLVNISPEISYAAWQFQRLCNPGYEYKAYNLGTEKAENAAAKDYLDQIFARLRERHGSADVVLGRLFMGAFLRGAFCTELVLDGEGRLFVDFATPDPFSILFRKVQDPVLKEVWVPGQWQKAKFVDLDIPTFKYIPIDPAPASPYGRSLAAPSLFAAVFSLSLLHDVKRVVMQQGYKRLDISVNSETATDMFTYDPQGYASLGEYIRAAITEVKTVYARLAPDDAFIHSDMFEIGTKAGTIDSDSINAIDRIMERLERSITRALKSNGVILDTSDNLNETDSNRKWEIHAAGIKSLQHHCENLLESLLTLALRAVGIQARVEFRFAELRAAEMFRDEQTRALRIQNARNEYEAGFVSQDEAANSAVNHDADVDEPRKPLVALEFKQDNNSGNEQLNKNEDETNRIIRLIDRRLVEMMRKGASYGKERAAGD